MGETSLELSLHQLGTCIKELTNRTQYLYNLFDTCLQDYNKNKQVELGTNNIHKEKLHSEPHEEHLNSTNQSKPSVRKEEQAEKSKKSKKLINKGKTQKQKLLTKRKNTETTTAPYVSNHIDDKLINEEIYNMLDTYDCQAPYNNVYNKNNNNMCVSEYINSGVNKCKKVTPNMNRIRRTTDSGQRRTRTGHINKKKVFSILTKGEKELILYDKIKDGAGICERKWGIHHSLLTTYINSSNTFSNNMDRADWIKQQKDNLGGIMRVQENIEWVLMKTHITQSIANSPIRIHDLCSMCFDRGLGVIAAKHNINLFELEYLLQELYPSEWGEMEKNDWFCVYRDGENNPIKMSRVDIVNLSSVEGVRYASKKSGVQTDVISRFRRELLEEGLLARGGIPVQGLGQGLGHIFHVDNANMGTRHNSIVIPDS